jgi:drug/metabolite transporter (DMT)-like permease
MSPQVKGALILVMAMLSFSTMGALAKLAASEVSSFEVVFFRGLVGMLIIPLVAWRRGVSVLGRRKGLLLARGAVGSTALVMFFYALANIPVGNAILLNQMTPIFVLPLAALFLGEKITWRHLVFVPLALVGAALVIKPSPAVINVPGFVALCSAAFAAGAYVLVRKLTATESTFTIVFWFTWVSMVVAVPFMWSSFVIPDPPTMAALVGVGVFGTVGQLLLTVAYRLGEAGRLAVLGSLGAIFGAGWDLVLWDHVPDLLTAGGGALVILACAMLQRMRHAAPDKQ